MLSPDQAVRRLLDSLPRPARLLVAVSGGSDSLGLLTLLAELCSDPAAQGIFLFAATIDHGLRPDSAAEAAAVGYFCNDRGIPHLVRSWAGAKPSSGVSAAAREARYELLTAVADELDATLILTGHTLDDQRETVVMRATRNDGADNPGLSGMARLVLLGRRRWLARPFLSTQRADIRAALVERGIAWIDDPSNINPASERVRVRQALAAEALSVSVEIEEAGRRRQRLAEGAADLVRRHATMAQGVLVRLDREVLDAEPEHLRHGLSALAAVLGGRDHGLRHESLGRVSDFLAQRLPGRMTAGRVIFDLRRDGLYLQRENRGLPQIAVPAGTEAVWDGRYRIRNVGRDSMQVRAVPVDDRDAERLFPHVPPSIGRRAMSVMPDLRVFGDAASPEGFHAAPVIAPYERFLPVFEFDLAREIAVLLACDEIPRPPIHVCDRKS